jgi:FkbM family methyltransferase
MELDKVEIAWGGKQFLFRFRGDSLGDKGVISQIFQSLDYGVGQWKQGVALIEYHQRQSALRPSLIVDAGANIGASPVYFLNAFENSFVFAIEPDEDNWEILDLNTAAYGQKFNFLGAVAAQDGELMLVDPGLGDWGFRTQAIDDGARTGPTVKSISPASILAHPATQNMTPLIFKIDIEGGEAGLFGGDTSWMEQFPLIVIELHDWMLPFSGSSGSFLKAVARYEFDFIHKGENIFLFNRKLLAG